MASIADPGLDLAELGQRLRKAAEALRHLPAERARFRETMEELANEMKAIATQLR